MEREPESILDILEKRKPDYLVDVYLKEKPALYRFPDFLHFQLVSVVWPQKRYKWQPFGTELSFVDVTLTVRPHLYNFLFPYNFEKGHFLEELLATMDEDALPISNAFRATLKKDATKLVADQGMYALLQSNPKIRRLLSECPNFWALLQFSQGKPLYSASLEVHDASDGRVLPEVIAFVQHLCQRYDGKSSNDMENKLGKLFLLEEHSRSGAYRPVFCVRNDSVGL